MISIFLIEIKNITRSLTVSIFKYFWYNLYRTNSWNAPLKSQQINLQMCFSRPMSRKEFLFTQYGFHIVNHLQQFYIFPPKHTWTLTSATNSFAWGIKCFGNTTNYFHVIVFVCILKKYWIWSNSTIHFNCFWVRRLNYLKIYLL